MKTKKSQKLYKRAITLMPGGVNSPVRAFKAVGGNPLFISKAKGSKLYDVDGNQYIDYVLSWGPLILGHAYPTVVKALQKAAEKGTSYGAPTELEIKLAELVREAFPSIEKIRMVNSGTEATMSAIRVARGFTKRSKVIKFEGCYHGHVDGLLVSAGSGGVTFGIPDSFGIPSSYSAETIVLPFNDIEALKTTIKQHWKDIACIILEPVVGNMGCILPKKEFLFTLREETTKHGIILIFDEVMTGFRVSFGGAQAYYGMNPDLTCLGKVIGGGLPVGAYGGKKEIMQIVTPEGGVYQAGTLSGNPLAMTAGIETLKILKKSSTYKKLEKTMDHLEKGLKEVTEMTKIKAKFYRAGTMFCTYFTETEVIDAKSAKTSDIEKFKKFFWGMLGEGVYMAPSQFEAGFISLSHSEKDIEKTIKSAYKVFKRL